MDGRTVILKDYADGFLFLESEGFTAEFLNEDDENRLEYAGKIWDVARAYDEIRNIGDYSNFCLVVVDNVSTEFGFEIWSYAYENIYFLDYYVNLPQYLKDAVKKY